MYESYAVRFLGGSLILLGALPLALRWIGLTKDYGEGVIVGTGVAIVWYTVETAYLRREMAKQNRIVSDQSETAIRPLLVSRIEHRAYAGQIVPSPRAEFVIRNIGHGPALFVQVQGFTVRTQYKGSVLVHIDPIDLVEPDKVEIPILKPDPSPVGGQRPDPDELVHSLSPQTAPDDCEIVISYENIRGQRFASAVRMGRSGTKLVRHGPK